MLSVLGGPPADYGAYYKPVLGVQGYMVPTVAALRLLLLLVGLLLAAVAAVAAVLFLVGYKRPLLIELNLLGSATWKRGRKLS